MEMKSILNQGDKYALILGDEIFNSTETESAICLMNACIQKLHNLNSFAIFATHFHELYELQTIQDLLQKNLKICHLNVSFRK